MTVHRKGVRPQRDVASHCHLMAAPARASLTYSHPPHEPPNIMLKIKRLHARSLLTPAADLLAAARSALAGLRLRRIPMVAFPSNSSLAGRRKRRRTIRFGSGVQGVSFGLVVEIADHLNLEKSCHAPLTADYFRDTISVTDISVKMVKHKIDPESLLPLTPAVFQVLLALAGGELHGYAIMQEVAESTEGRIKMGPGTLYGTIKRLLEAELIEESNERPDPKLDDERRRYYKLTGVGEQVVRAEARRYAEIVARARGKKLIQPLLPDAK